MSEMAPALLSFDLEITNLCNNNCSICPRSCISRDLGLMKYETLKTIADTLCKYRPLITISGMGDPLLHPELPEFIRYLKMKSLRVSLVVNIASLSGLDKEIIDKVIDSEPDNITISVPSIEEESLKEIYDKSIDIEKIKMFFDYISKFHRIKTRFRVSAIITDLNENVRNFKEFFLKTYKIPVWITKIHSRGGNLNRPRLYKGREIKENQRCNLFIFHSFIDKDGNILSCCHDLSGETAFAHISEGAEKILKKKRDILKLTPHFSLCNRCDEPLRFIKLPENIDRLNFYQLTKKVKIY